MHFLHDLFSLAFTFITTVGEGIAIALFGFVGLVVVWLAVKLAWASLMWLVEKGTGRELPNWEPWRYIWTGHPFTYRLQHRRRQQ